jgi:hypothetical protein
MNERSAKEFEYERQSLDATHIENETSRDSFIGLAHTALFASSVSFVGDITPLTEVVWRPVLIFCWLSSVVGLLALTFSFGAARRAIDVRREALHNREAPENKLCDTLNAVALWSFPMALMSLFIFVSVNVIGNMSDKTTPPPPTPLSKGVNPPARAPAFYNSPKPGGGVPPAPRAPERPMPPPPPPPSPKT